MSEDHTVQVSFGEVRYVPAPERQPEPGGRFGLKAISEAAAAIWTIVLRTALIGSVVAVLFVTYAEVMRDTVIVEEIGLPEPLAKMGYSGTVAAHRLWDSTVWINAHAGTTKPRASLVADSRQLEITEPGTGLSLSGLVGVIRRLLGREQPRVAGEFVCRDAACTLAEMELRLRAFHDGAMTVAGVGRLGSVDTEAEIDAYFDRAALELLAMIDPYVRASFLYAVESGELPPEAESRADALVTSLGPLPPGISGSRSAFEANRLLSTRHPQRAWAALLLGVAEERNGNPEAAIEWATRSVTMMDEDRVEKFPNAYNDWGAGLARAGRHDEAIEKYEAAIKIDPDQSVVYSNFGASLDRLGRYEDAIQKFEAAIRIDPGDAVTYYNLANSLANLGRHLEAFERYGAALRIDPTFRAAFNNWAVFLGRFVSEGDVDACPRLAAELPRLQAHAADPDWALALDRFKDLLAACAATAESAVAQ